MTSPILLVTRPVEEAPATAAAVRAAGFEPLCSPLIQILPLHWELPADFAPDALLFTSARAPEALTPPPSTLAHIPAYAVGNRTATAADAAGFDVIAVGSSDGSAIVSRLARDGHRHVLHLSGEQTAPLHVPDSIRLERVAVYAAALAPGLSANARSALASRQIFATLLFSPRTAQHFRALLDEADIAPSEQRIVAISPAILAAAGSGWLEAAVSAAPELEQALVAAQRLWQGRTHG